jgi:hypothetical protein
MHIAVWAICVTLLPRLVMRSVPGSSSSA